jgi:hypothetical protein
MIIVESLLVFGVWQLELPELLKQFKNNSMTKIIKSFPPSQIVNNFRLSLLTATPVTTTNQTYSAAQTLYCTPYNGSYISLFNGTSWDTFSSAEFSIALGTLTNAVGYDVFAYSNSGVPTLELLAWTNATSRATNLVYQNGVLCKTGALTRRYLGSFYNGGNQTSTVTMTIASPCVVTYTGHGLLNNAPVVFTNSGGNLPTGIVSGTTYYVASIGTTLTNSFNVSATPGGALINTSGSQAGTHTCTVPTYTEDSTSNRWLFNYYNSQARNLSYTPPADFNYTVAANAIWGVSGSPNLATKLTAFVGVSEALCSFQVTMARSNSTGAILNSLSLGINSAGTATGSAASLKLTSANDFATNTAGFTTTLNAGYSYVAPFCFSTATGTCTWKSSGALFEGVVQA